MLLAESFMPDLQYTVRTKGNPINIIRKNNKILVNKFFILMKIIILMKIKYHIMILMINLKNIIF